MSGDNNPPKIEDVPSIRRITADVTREKSIRRGHISNLHMWWARRPLVSARAAVYGALAPADKRDPDFLKSLCTYSPVPEVLEAAQQNVLDEHVRRMSKDRGRQIQVEQVKSGRIPAPRVLDMFAGGGSIPLEAMRLGAETYALDLNPVAYLIEICTLNFPQLYGRLSNKTPGSGQDHTWAGLEEEVKHWAGWVQDRVQAELSSLYPKIRVADSTNKDDLIPLAYLWTRTIVCQNPSCGATVPLSGPLRVERRQESYLAFVPIVETQTNGIRYQLQEAARVEDVEQKPHPGLSRGRVVCPHCGETTEVRQAVHLKSDTALMGLICLSPDTGEKVYLSTDMVADQVEPAEQVCLGKLEQLVTEDAMSLPDEPLPAHPMFQIRRYGFSKYSDIFTRRQLLLLLTYVKHIQAAYLAMVELRMDAEHAKALATYLSLLLSNSARYHNALSRWNGYSGSLEGLFARQAMAFTGHFAEVNPFLSPFDLGSLAGRAAEVIHECSEVGSPAKISCASATALPFEDEYFDAVVTDPPYYDAVPYADLSDFFYIWLKRCTEYLYSDLFRQVLSPKKDEIVVAAHRHKNHRDEAVTTYEQMMASALKEAYRVLKPDRLLTVMFYSHRHEVLQIYLDIAQRAGFELFEVSRFVSEKAPIRSKDRDEDEESGGDFILHFRKSAIGTSLPFATADAGTVLELVEDNRPNLYGGLAEIILENALAEDIEPLIPPQYAGSIRDRLAEYIASCENPEQFLTDTLGLVQLRRIAREKSWLTQPDETGTVAATILRQVGFNIPSPPQEGVEAAIEELNRLVSQVVTANDISQLQGYLTRGMNLVELMLRRAAWAWAEAVFSQEAREHLCQVAEVDSLDRLAMGHIKKIFCDLPNHIVQTPYLNQAQKLFGRPHIYKPTKFVRDLDQLVEIRNRVAHNKEGYLDVTPMAEMKQEFTEKLRLAATTLQKLKEQKAIPLLGRAIREIRDLFDRRTIVLQMENNTIREVFTMAPMTLGENYFYLGDNNNPRPVDPVMLPLSDVIETPL